MPRDHQIASIEAWTKGGLVTFYLLFVMELKSRRVHRMVFFGEASLRNAVREYADHHYRHERNHQGLGNQIIEPGEEVGRASGEVKCRERFGGMLRYYYREAA